MWWRLDAVAGKKSWQETAPGQNLFRYFERQPNDVRERAAISRHDHVAMLLDRVTTCLVECVHTREVGFDHGFVDRLERDVARHAFVQPNSGAFLTEGKPRENRVRAAAQASKHSARFV